MRFGHIELFVADPLKSMAFYRDILGFTVTTIQAEKYVWLQLGTQEILLRPVAGDSTAPQIRDASYVQTSIGMVLYTDTLSTTIAELEAKDITFIPMPDGCVSFTDPDGHWFQLVNPEHE